MYDKAALALALSIALMASACKADAPAVDPSAGAPRATTPQKDQTNVSSTEGTVKLSEAPPDAGSVMYLIYGRDGDGATSYEIENGSVATYWFGHAFELAGKPYFSAFATDTPEKFGTSDEENYPDPDAGVNITAAVFEGSPPGAGKPWTFVGAERSIGEFGGNEQAPQVDTKRKAQGHATPSGHYVLAVPTTTFISGVTQAWFDVFAFNPGELAKTKDTHWTHVGSLAAGSDNSAACDEGEVMPCATSTGTLTFEPGSGGDLPAIRIALAGNSVDAPGQTRGVGADATTVYRYDSASKTYTD